MQLNYASKALGCSAAAALIFLRASSGGIDAPAGRLLRGLPSTGAGATLPPSGSSLDEIMLSMENMEKRIKVLEEEVVSHGRRLGGDEKTTTKAGNPNAEGGILSCADDEDDKTMKRCTFDQSVTIIIAGDLDVKGKMLTEGEFKADAAAEFAGVLQAADVKTNLLEAFSSTASIISKNAIEAPELDSPLVRSAEVDLAKFKSLDASKAIFSDSDIDLKESQHKLSAYRVSTPEVEASVLKADNAANKIKSESIFEALELDSPLVKSAEVDLAKFKSLDASKAIFSDSDIDLKESQHKLSAYRVSTPELEASVLKADNADNKIKAESDLELTTKKLKISDGTNLREVSFEISANTLAFKDGANQYTVTTV